MEEKNFMEKGGIAQMSNFTFSHYVFHAMCILKFFNPFPNKPWFLRVCSTSLLKTQWGKEKLLVTSNFSFSHSVFYPFGELYTIFIKLKIVVCEFFSIWKSLQCRLGKG